MKATTRPARRMSAARHAALTAKLEAQHQARELAWQARQDAAQQLVAPTPEWKPAPRLTMLPGGLHWSAQQPVPAIGATVAIAHDGHAEPVKVAAYCHVAGFLALVIEPQKPKRTSRKPRPNANYVFAHQLAKAA
jgi:hypothetical protein